MYLGVRIHVVVVNTNCTHTETKGFVGFRDLKSWIVASQAMLLLGPRVSISCSSVGPPDSIELVQLSMYLCETERQTIIVQPRSVASCFTR